jgi:hemerythrin-like domain-containing protein
MKADVLTENRDAIQILVQDHNELKRVMNALEDAIMTENVDDMGDLFQEFKRLYNLHDEIEDEILYPALRDFPETHKLILKSYQAHHVVHVGVLELRLVPYRSEDWGPKFLVIKDSILSHIKEEESRLFEHARLLLDSGKLEELGREILEYKDKNA